jgi:hypothetical protein
MAGNPAIYWKYLPFFRVIKLYTNLLFNSYNLFAQSCAEFFSGKNKIFEVRHIVFVIQSEISAGKLPACVSTKVTGNSSHFLNLLDQRTILIAPYKKIELDF